MITVAGAYRCDDCGRFFSPDTPGWSWLHVPGVWPMSYEEEHHRCVTCTTTLGVPKSRQNVRHELVSGVYATHPTDRSESDE